jgi:hypothetical protein
VLKAALLVNSSISRTLARVGGFVDSWKRHSGLWKTDKAPVLDKFKATAPTNTAFNEKLAKYTKVGAASAGLGAPLPAGA